MMRTPTIDAPNPEDAAGVTALMHRADESEIGRQDSTEEELRAAWVEPGFVLATDAWVLREDAQITGYAEVTVRSPGVDFDLDHRVHPDLGTPRHHTLLIDAMLARAQSLATSADAVVGEYAPREAAPRREALALAGFRVERLVHRLAIEFDEAPAPAIWPSDVTVRNMGTPNDARAVHQAIQSAFVGHFRFAPEAFGDWLARQCNHPRYDRRLFKVAFRNGEPIAAIEVLDVGDFGWIPRLGVVTSARGMGLGRALLLETFGALWAKGQRRVELGVDSENATGATQLYERVGMRIVERYDLFRRRVHTA